jgi:biotin carboxylase
VRDVVRPETDGIFRAGNDLLLEQYLDGVEFDVDLVMDDGECVFSSVSQNWPTAEPSLQETGLHCPPDHGRRAVRGLVDLCVRTAQAFGLRRGVLHVEGKCTSRGPRIVEVNTRMGGGRIHQIVEAVWGVDLIEAQLRSSLDLPQALTPSRRPRCAVVNAIVHAPATGRLEALPLGDVPPEEAELTAVDVDVEIGQTVLGPDRTFATPLVEVTVSGRTRRHARALCARILQEPPLVASAGAAVPSRNP